MSCNNGRRVHDRIAEAFRTFSLPFRNPDGRQMKGRFKSGYARNFFLNISGVHSHIMVKENFSLADLNSLNFYNILVWIQLNVITQPDDRYHCTKFQSNLSSYHYYPVKQISTLVDIRQWNNTVAEFQLDGVHLKQAVNVFGLTYFLRRSFLGIYLLLYTGCFQICGNQSSSHNEQKSHSHKKDGIQICNNTQKCKSSSNQIHHLGNAEKLFDHSRAEIRFFSALGDKNTCGKGNQQRRNLTDQSVTDGKNTVIVQCCGDIAASPQHTHGNTAYQVDYRQQKSGYGITFYVFHGTVHGAEKVCFQLYFITSELRFLIINGTCIQIGINSHLLSGHCIQCKSCGYLCHTLRTFVDYQKLNQNQDDKDNGTDNQITAAHKLTESLYHVSGGAGGQNQSGGGDIQGNSEDCGKQEDCGKVR